ncbi:MAG: peptidase C1 [Flavobacteriales bacterium]|nr:peptidase C1 [Flavobacteriales bacterium]MBK6945503.1 peptidase C1 [Flavobacteriales bacterium]MBK7241617.1 peptidase C1 [Flavobacteriales bacterium]MBK9534940.1 peptidase C1 [Flavobacteriales bacterium]HQV51306.1 C1 family peptidase [Flavobacteriales bacterium]
MPIRMVPDEGQNGSNRSSTPRRSTNAGGGGIGGGLGSLLPMILGFLIKKPKLLLVVIALALLYWFTIGKNSGGNDMISQLAGFTTGAKFDPKLYDKAEVYEPLADNVKNPLPERASLEAFCPPRMNQGQQGSCVAWASAYAARTIVQAKATNADPKSSAFSPSYLYNQIKIDNSDCQGSYIFRAMDTMLKGGALPFSKFGYTDQNCSKQPTAEEKQQALPYRIKGFQRLTLGADEQRTDMLAMKQQLSQGSPIVIGMMVGGTFMRGMEGQDVWIPTDADYEQRGFGGHAMCVVGYDDYKFGDTGGFQIMNSWGPEWGNNGLAWLPYPVFDYFAKEAYAVYPQGEGVDEKPTVMDIQFGFIDNATKKNIPLRNIGGNVFRSTTPIAKGAEFKIEVTNNAECYTYVFGQEVDGRTYVLFPYTPKHSPYCGITGTRLFPNDYSLKADDEGTVDVMAILITNQPFDYPKLNEAMLASTAQGLDAKLNEVLGSELAMDVRYTDGQTIGASSSAGKNALAIVLELEKK